MNGKDQFDPQPGADDGEIAAARSRAQLLRMLEAILFAAAEPLDLETITARLPTESDVEALLEELTANYAHRGVNIVCVAGKYTMRTPPDLAKILEIETTVTRKLSRAAVETLAIIAYHQKASRDGATRAEIEEIRGVALSRGTLDVLMEAGWIRPGAHRDTPGRPTMWVTTEAFMSHFGLASLDDLPNIDELKAAGLLDPRPAVSPYSEEGELASKSVDDESDDADEVEPETIPEADDEPPPGRMASAAGGRVK